MRRLLLHAAILLSTANALAVQWPTAGRYKVAMQNPMAYITDPRLAGATIPKDQLNAPLSYSGSFSTVFPVTTKSGRKIALRVFHPTGDVAERQDAEQMANRFQKLSQYLNDLRGKKSLPPEIVEFALVRNALRIDNQSLPAMKLPWIEGRELDGFIERRLKQGNLKSLDALAKNWRLMMRDFDKVGIAHGDLHHQNVKIDGNEMRLLDYDSMYVPTLKGQANSEIGHPNFQHPYFHYRFGKAVARPYDEKMDRFSSILIYTSILALRDNPKLWAKFHNEHNLIFEGQRDLNQPDTSPVFAALRASKDGTVRRMGELLAQYAKGLPEHVPTLETAIKAASAPAKPWYQANQQGK